MKSSRLAVVLVLLFALLAFITSILGNLVATWIEEPLRPFRLPLMLVFGVSVVLLVGYEFVQRLSATTDRTHVASGSDARNRRAMIDKVRAYWIDGVYKRSLYREVLIALRLIERLDAVIRPLDLLVQRPDRSDEPLPAKTRIIDAFRKMGGALLILGMPGVGKTTLLLELTDDLLDHAVQDPTHPIPVVFPLSSWGEKRRSLAEWLVDELVERYDVPRKTAQEWVETNQVLPLLDGLDEVNSCNRIVKRSFT